MNYNKVTIAGNITRDIEQRTTPSGVVVASFGVAINSQYKSKEGETKKNTTFVDVEAFGKTAENIAKFFKKGSCIFIEGSLKFEQWEKDGKTNSKLKVTANSFEFVDKKSDDKKDSDDVTY